MLAVQALSSVEGGYDRLAPKFDHTAFRTPDVVLDATSSALRPGGVFALPVGAPPPVTSGWYWGLLGFDLVMRVRNAVWRPPFVMYYRTCPLHAVRDDLAASGFTVTTVPWRLSAGARTAARDTGLSSRAGQVDDPWPGILV